MSLNYILNSTLNCRDDNRFDNFIHLCQSQFDKPVYNMTEMRMRQNKKLRGDLFEEFCKLYLIHIYKVKFEHVWLHHEIPDDVRTKLGLRNQDMGIDIIARDYHNRYYAVQVKYRKPKDKNQYISWKQLSTFYALVYRSGPYHKHIVMCNVNGVRHITKKGPKDVSICIGTFRKMTYFDWLKIVGERVEKTIDQPSKEEVRNRRLAYFDRLNKYPK